MKKGLIIISVLLGILLLAAVLVPYLFRDKLMVMLKEEINKQVEATVDFDRLGISIFRNFPDLTLSMQNFSVIGEDEFEGDTLALIQNFRLTVDIMSAIRGDVIELKRIRLDDPYFNLIINESGVANWDIVPESEIDPDAPVAEESEMKFSLRGYSLRRANIIYTDMEGMIFAELLGLNHSGSGDFTLSNFVLSTETDIEQLTVSYEGFKYLNKAKMKLLTDLNIDLDQSLYGLEKFDLTLNELQILMNGTIGMPESGYDLDLSFEAPRSDFNQLLSVIPAAYTDDFRDVRAGGTFSLNGTVKGLYVDELYPAFDIQILANRGSFQYPGLPASVAAIDMDLSITNPGGVYDQTIIDLKKLSMLLDNEPFNLALKMTNPETDPHIDMKGNTRLDLSKVPGYYPLEGVELLSGRLLANVEARGRLSAVEQERYADFHAAGRLTLDDFAYQDADLPYPLKISKMELSLSPRAAQLSTMNGEIGSTDFDLTGNVDNLIAYMFNGGVLKGRFDLKSKHADLNEWMTGETDPVDDTEMEIIPVPDNLDFRFTGNFDKILYDNLELDNTSGTLIIRDAALRLVNLRTNTLNARIAMNGVYDTKDLNNPTFSMDYDITNLSIPLAYENFVTVASFAPVAQFVEGTFNSKMSMSAKLQPDMMPDLQTVNANGNLVIPSFRINNFTPLKKLAEQLKVSSLSNWSANNLRLNYVIKDGRMMVEPFDVRVSDILVNIYGSNGLDQSLDYVMKFNIPRQRLGQASDLISNLADQSGIPGLASALPDMVQFNVRMTGTIEDPRFSIGLGEATTGRPVVDRAREEAREQIDRARAAAEEEAERLRKEAEERARAEVDKARESAEAEADRIRKEAEAEAERVRREAEERARKEAQEQEKRIRDRIGFP